MNSLSDRLKALVKNLERDDLTTTEALLVDMTGSRVAAQMLNRLLIWWPKATNKEGWVYKSEDEWWAELRIKTNELTKAKGALEMAGVVIRVKQAAVKSDKTISGWAAAPVRHYRLDLRRFLRRLASALGINIKKLAALMKKPFDGRAKMVSSNGEKTITTSLQTNPQTSVVVQQAIQEVKNLGVNGKNAQQMVAAYGGERVLTQVNLARQNAKHNAAGWLIESLRENWQYAPIEVPQIALPDASQALPDDHTGDDASEPLVKFEPPPEPETPECAIWKKAYTQLEIQLDRASFDTWVRAARFLRSEGETYVIGVPNQYARDMLQHRLYRDVRRIVSNVAGTAVDLLFEECKRVAVAESDLPLFQRLEVQ
ncbi:MAG: DnaA N-terminal domain-containing protein [Chloroflexota bacterium]